MIEKNMMAYPMTDLLIQVHLGITGYVMTGHLMRVQHVGPVGGTGPPLAKQ